MKVNEFKTYGAARTQFSQEIDEHSTLDQFVRDDTSLIDPATILFEITFGFRPKMQRNPVIKSLDSTTGIIPIIHIWM